MNKKIILIFVSLFLFINVSVVRADNIQNEAINFDSNENISDNNELNVTSQSDDLEGNIEQSLDKKNTKNKLTSNVQKDLNEGIYIIQSALDNKVLESADGDSKDGTNVRINQNYNLDYQKWIVKKTSDGYYNISPYHSQNSSLDVAYGSLNDGTNAWIYSSNGTNAQKWKLVLTEDGYYNIVSLCNNLTLDVAGGNSSNGTNVWLYTSNNTDAQKFKFVEAKDENKKTIEDGTYVIETAFQNKVLDAAGGIASNGTNVQIYQRNFSFAQAWNIKYLEDGYYSITTYLNDNYSLDVAGGNDIATTNVQIYENNGTNAQKWLIKDAGDGYFYLLTYNNHKALDIQGANSSSGTNIWLYDLNGSNAQKFKFVEANDENKKTIEDGTYVIETAFQDKVLDAAGGIASNGTNVQIYQRNFSFAQAWNIKYLEDGYYSITTYLNDNYSLDVAGGNDIATTNVQIYENNGTNAQKWLIKDAGDGYFYLLTYNNHKALDITGGGSSDGTNIWLYDLNGSNAQKFKFKKYSTKLLEDGIYTIKSVANENKSISLNNEVGYVGSNIELDDENNSNSQKWSVRYLGNGLYSINYVLDQYKTMDVAGAGMSSGTNVWLYSTNGSYAQKWYLKYNDDGTYTIISSLNGLALNAQSDNILNNANITTSTSDDSQFQKFRFEKTDINYYTKTYEDGYYVISSFIDDNKVLDAAGARKANETNVQLYDRNNTNAQIWYLKYIDNGYYYITSSMNPGVSLDVAWGSLESGANVQLYKSNNSDSQMWLLKLNEDGSVSIISKKNGLMIDVAGGSLFNGNNIQMYRNNNSNSQKFKLNKYDGQKIYHGIDVSSHQGYIDWDQVANNGIDFAIIRAGFGMDLEKQDDSQLINNVANCERLNIPYALYLYSYAYDNYGSMGADAEANHIIRIINKLKELGYNPTLGKKVFYDMEDDSTINFNASYDENKYRLTNNAKIFCSKVESTGYKCGIYANKTWFNNFLSPNEFYNNNYTIWLAYYPNGVNSFSSLGNIKPDYYATPYNIWQFCSDGSVPGINGNVDLDIGYNIFD